MFQSYQHTCIANTIIGQQEEHYPTQEHRNWESKWDVFMLYASISLSAFILLHCL